MNNGYIKLHRKLLNNPIVMKDADYLAVWIYLLLNATHKEIPALFKGKKITLMPGQLITSTISISKKLLINKDKVQRILNAYEHDKQIAQQTSSKGRLIFLENWNVYQDFDIRTDKQMINNCETTDKQVITNNKDKNVINISSSTTRKNELNAREENDNANGRYGNERNGDESLLEFVEKSFGRTISSTEMDHILNWEDTELTRYAVKEAVLSQACNVKYIDRILERYKREGYKSVTDIVGGKKVRSSSEEKKVLSKEEQEILNYNWLE